MIGDFKGKSSHLNYLENNLISPPRERIEVRGDLSESPSPTPSPVKGEGTKINFHRLWVTKSSCKSCFFNREDDSKKLRNEAGMILFAAPAAGVFIMNLRYCKPDPEIISRGLHDTMSKTIF